jgi:hypothetical protein
LDARYGAVSGEALGVAKREAVTVGVGVALGDALGVGEALGVAPSVAPELGEGVAEGVAVALAGGITTVRGCEALHDKMVLHTMTDPCRSASVALAVFPGWL